jgi:hypothetical protein
VLRTFGAAYPAPSAFFRIYIRQAVIAHGDSAKLAHFSAIAKALAAPGTGLDAAGCNSGCPARFYADVFASLQGLVFCASAGKDSDLRLDICVPAYKGRKFFGCRASANRAFGNIGLLFGHG